MLATFVDILIVPSETPQTAVKLQELVAEYLSRHWRLHIGADSRELIACKGWQDFSGIGPEWSIRTTMKTLGHTLAADCSIEPCFRETTSSMTKAFYGNVRLGLKRCSQSRKIKFLKTCILPIACSRWARWPWQKSYAQRLDKIQRQFIAVLFDIKAMPDEDYSMFVLRRRAVTQTIARDMGPWSVEWARGVMNWSAHVKRNHDSGSWIPRLLAWHDSVWLVLRRLLHSSPGESRTRTRSFRGKVECRWEDGLVEARRVSP